MKAIISKKDGSNPLKYILVTNVNPLCAELSKWMYKPEKDKSLFIIKISHNTIPVRKGTSLILNDQYNIEIMDMSTTDSCLTINNLCITKIEYEYQTDDITFTISEGKTVVGHKVVFKRTTFEIRENIINALKIISSIPTNTSILAFDEFVKQM